MTAFPLQIGVTVTMMEKAKKELSASSKGFSVFVIFFTSYVMIRGNKGKKKPQGRHVQTSQKNVLAGIRTTNTEGHTRATLYYISPRMYLFCTR